MKGYIYKITNKVNGMSYIGQTRYTVEFRWRQHQHKKNGCYFHNALHKYGVENFTVETLEECEVSKLNEREIFYIAKYNTFDKGYNLTIGGDGRRKIVTDNQYDEIKELYLSGFSSNKIATLYNVDKATIVKILKIQGVKIRESKRISINNQEFLELVADYKNGFSLKELSKRYDCDPKALKNYLIRKGIDVRNKYSILDNEEAQKEVIKDYLDTNNTLKEVLQEHHISFNTFKKILSIHGISQGKKHFKISEKESLEAIGLFNQGYTIQNIARHFKVDKCTIYSLFKRYHVNYLKV